MISLPFHKWKLNFYENDFELQYEEHSNKIRLVGFKILNLLMTFAALIALIIFVVQQQPYVLIIMMAAVVFCCFGLYLLSPKLQSRLKFVFSAMYVWSVATNVMIAMSGIDIPNFFFGFNSSALILGIMQFSDNKLKVVYTTVTPLLLIILFQVYTQHNIQFMLHSGACMSFVSVLTYMYEYTQRLAFSLNLIANKQKEIIDEFVTDSMFAISLDKRTRQFNLEFKNKTFENQLKNINGSEQIRQFLRNSFIVNNMNESQRLSEKNLNKLQKLEEFCFIKIKTYDGYMNAENQDNEIEIIQQDKHNQKLCKMKLIIKTFNFGKPILIIIIKTEQMHNLIQSYENDIMDFQQSIVNYSQEIINKQANINQEIKKIKQHFSKNVQDQMFLKLQCLNLQIMNFVRNYLLYFQQDKIPQISQVQQFSNLNEYVDTIQQYLSTIADYYSVKFLMNYQMETQFQFNINIKFLTQVLINLFQLILNNSIKNQIISLSIIEELLPQKNKQAFQQMDTKKKLEESQTQSKQFMDLRLISFTFTFYSQHHVNFEHLQLQSVEFSKILKNLNQISEYVTCYLLDQMGPNNFVQINKVQVQDSSQQIYYQNRLKFLIYSDQSQIEPSFLKQIPVLQKKF